MPGGTGSKLFLDYQVLVNEEGSARLEWKHWEQFQAMPPGSVNTASDIFVARELANPEVKHHFLGGLHLGEQYGLIVVPPNGRRLTSGQLLIEHLPIKYELVSFKPDRLRSVHRLDVELESFVQTDKVQNYTFLNELYFGRGQNIATGSPVILHLTNGTKVNFQWGIPLTLPQRWRTHLSLKQGQKAVIKATRLEKQWDYYATLSAHYRDGAILMRPIKASMIYTSSSGTIFLCLNFCLFVGCFSTSDT